MMLKRISAMLICIAILFNIGVVYADDPYTSTGFTLIETKETPDLDGTMYYFRHNKTGAEVIYLDNDAERRDFSIGFKTPPTDNKGANHVLEHSLLCGSEKYPTKNIMHYIRGNALAESINAITSDDCTYYEIKTPNETEYYHLMDVYMNGIFHPLLLTDENIFKQQGIRLEYVDGQVQYNGVVYNELRINSLDSTENSVNFLADCLYTALYGDTTPSCNSGGSIEALKDLTYQDVLRVYNTYYVPSNSMTYLAGKQDIHKTLAFLDSFFQAFDKQNISISFQDTKQQPEEKVSEYNVTSDTKTVDIGFMSSGVPMAESAEELYARDILYNLISKKMAAYHDMNYTSGGNSGGISNLALLVSQVPVEKKAEILSAYDTILAQLAQEGFTAIDAEIDSYIAQRQNPYLYAVELGVFNGILYHNQPFYYTDISGVVNRLKESPEIFEAALKKYFTENPYSKIVVSGNGGVSMEEEPPVFSEAELAKIKQDTEAFEKWVDEPDDPDVIASIPSLSLDEVKEPPAYSNPVHEAAENIDFYYTEKRESENAALNLLFPVQVDTADLGYLQLLVSYISTQAMHAGIDSTYIDLACMENHKDPDKINPQISIYINGSNDTIAESFQKIMNFLKDENIWNESTFSEYLKSTPSEIRKNSYRDPYYLSYELKQSSQSAGNSFYAFTRGSIGQGSVLYYHFLQNAKPEAYSAMMAKVQSMLRALILNSKPTVEFVGGSGYNSIKQAVCEQFKEAVKAGDGKVLLPIGYNSAATITTLEDANHFMLSGYIADSAYTYSGKMDVLGSVLTSNYILPTMRGKYGAYGASARFDQTGMTCAVAGLTDIDLAIEIWNGMGNYLRNLTMTQKELDAVIIPVVKDYDEYYNDSDYGAIMALCGKTPEDIKHVRDEMLSTTVEDLRSYADFVDEMVKQGGVFAVLGKSAADNAKFDFSYYANAGTLTVTPRLTRYAKGYVTGKTKTEFCPDDNLTRAEAAQFIAKLTADKRTADGASPYSDVSTEDWYYNAVVSLSEKGILNGYSDGSFKPDSSISRAEFAAVLAKFIYEAATVLEIEYKDIQESDWFYPAMVKMIGHGYINGYEDNMLYPNKPITRAEAVTVINRMLGITYKEAMQNPFSDTQNHWAYQEITAAVN